jgi:hypothetical protein
MQIEQCKYFGKTMIIFTSKGGTGMGKRKKVVDNSNDRIKMIDYERSVFVQGRKGRCSFYSLSRLFHRKSPIEVNTSERGVISPQSGFRVHVSGSGNNNKVLACEKEWTPKG